MKCAITNKLNRGNSEMQLEYLAYKTDSMQ